jgi:hypothetical protein
LRNLSDGGAIHADKLAEAALVDFWILVKNVEYGELGRREIARNPFCPKQLVRLLETADEMAGLLVKVKRPYLLTHHFDEWYVASPSFSPQCGVRSAPVGAWMVTAG